MILLVSNLDELTRMIGKKWVVQIIQVLENQNKIRFNEIKDNFPKITSTTLSSILKELEKQKIIKKNVFKEIPIRVEYSLTREGKNLIKAIMPLQDWIDSRGIKLNSSQKTVFAKAIEKSLLDLGTPELRTVIDQLQKKYNCSLLDCYENPEYLKHILCDMYGEIYPDILDSIKNNLKSFRLLSDSSEFIKIMEG